MSLETWKAEFYPVEAGGVSKEDATEHCLRKWRGLRSDAIARHGLRQSGPRLREYGEGGGELKIGSTTCAYCQHYGISGGSDWCESCPLKLLRDKPCDFGDVAPWRAWSMDGDPEPMIALLEQIKAKEEAEKVKSCPICAGKYPQAKEESNIAPCPWCGAEGTLHSPYADMHWGRCKKCEASGPREYSKRAAIAAWNKVAHQQHRIAELEAEIGRLQRAYAELDERHFRVCTKTNLCQSELAGLRLVIANARDTLNGALDKT